MSFGQTLRHAREAKNLTPSQVAAQTRILVQIVSDMEKEDFHRIPAPIYGRGFVRLIASCLDLDPAPLVEEFMEIYEGRRSPFTPSPVPPRVPGTLQPPPIPTPPPPSPEPIPEAPPIVTQFPFAPDPAPMPTPAANPIPEPIAESMPASVPEPMPTSMSEPEPAPMPTPAPEPAPTSAVPTSSEPKPPAQPNANLSGLDLFDQANGAMNGSKAPEVPIFTPPPPRRPEPYIRDNGESPFLPPSFGPSSPSTMERFRDGATGFFGGIANHIESIPRSTWRICMLGIAALAIIALIAFACIKLYQATARMPTPDPVAQVPAPSAPATPAKPVASTKPPAATPAKPTTNAKPGANATKPAAATKPTAQNPGTLSSTGQKIPSLYVD